jgi:hypothetical protein
MFNGCKSNFVEIGRSVVAETVDRARALATTSATAEKKVVSRLLAGC